MPSVRLGRKSAYKNVLTLALLWMLSLLSMISHVVTLISIRNRSGDPGSNPEWSLYFS